MQPIRSFNHCLFESVLFPEGLLPSSAEENFLFYSKNDGCVAVFEEMQRHVANVRKEMSQLFVCFNAFTQLTRKWRTCITLSPWKKTSTCLPEQQTHFYIAVVS